MSSNVRALEPVWTVHGHTGRPDRAEVEAAVHTILRWTGDNPERGGLIDIRPGHSGAGGVLRRLRTRSRRDPAQILRRDRRL